MGDRARDPDQPAADLVDRARTPAPHGYGTAAGPVVAARGGFRDTGPVNREPTARPKVAAGIPALQGGGGCQNPGCYLPGGDPRPDRPGGRLLPGAVAAGPAGAGSG